MFASVVQSSRLLERLDADFYAPEHVAVDTALADSGVAIQPFGGLVRRIFKGAFYILASEYSKRGVPFIRVSQITSGEVELGDVVFLPPKVHHRERKTEVRPDYLLFAKGGSIGNCAVVPASLAQANISQDVIGVEPGDAIDSRFAAAMFTCRYGRPQMLRWATGNVQLHLTNDSIREFRFPAAALAAQRYAGSKIRQAEMLRERARVLAVEMADTFRNIHHYSPDRRLGSWRQGARTLIEERLDATFYTPPAVQLVDALRSEGAPEVAQLSILVKDGGFDPAKPISYFEIGGLDISTGCAWPTVVPAGEAPSRAQRVVRHWDILVGTVRPERKNVGIVPPSATGQLVATSGVAVLRAGTAERAAYLWGFLRSDAATEQLMRWNTGAAYPAIDDDVPPRVLIPAVTDGEMTRLGARWMRIPMLHAGAKALVAAARLLVEALIERKVSEAELVVAGKDSDADRALLSRLHDDGLDGTGERLFPDLDALAELLAEAAR